MLIASDHKKRCPLPPCDFDFMSLHLQANMSLGLLIIASFNMFKDGSGRSDYFCREFYRRETGPAPLRVGSYAIHQSRATTETQGAA
jgi:hypothetical protein